MLCYPILLPTVDPEPRLEALKKRMQDTIGTVADMVNKGMNAFEDFEGQLIQEVLSEHKGGTKDQLLTALRDGMDKHGPEGIQRVYLVHEGAKNATLFGCPKQSCGWKRQDKYLVMSIRYPAIPYKHNNENFQLAAHSLERRMAVLDVMQGNEDYLDVLELSVATVCIPHIVVDQELIGTYLKRLQDKLQLMLQGVDEMLDLVLAKMDAYDKDIFHRRMRAYTELDTAEQWLMTLKHQFDDLGRAGIDTAYIVAVSGRSNHSGYYASQQRDLPLQGVSTGCKSFVWRSPTNRWSHEWDTLVQTEVEKLRTALEKNKDIAHKDVEAILTGELLRTFPNFILSWAPRDSPQPLAVMEAGQEVLGSYDISTHQYLFDTQNASIIYSLLLLHPYPPK
ncbi:unnamed protein product, partial [Mesorhabditis spiculigera]